MVSLCAELGRECWTGEILDPPAAYEEQPPFLPEAFKQGQRPCSSLAWRHGDSACKSRAREGIRGLREQGDLAGLES